jgi:hypothetical protein
MNATHLPTSDAEIVPHNVSESDLRDEVNRRTARAGYTTRYGESRAATRIQGLVPWGKQKLNVWPRDPAGNLIG